MSDRDAVEREEKQKDSVWDLVANQCGSSSRWKRWEKFKVEEAKLRMTKHAARREQEKTVGHCWNIERGAAKEPPE